MVGRSLWSVVTKATIYQSFNSVYPKDPRDLCAERLYSFFPVYKTMNCVVLNPEYTYSFPLMRTCLQIK